MDEETLAILDDTLLAEAWHNAEVGVAVFDDERTVLTVNAAYLDLLGYSRLEIGSLKAGANLLADEPGRAAVIDLRRRSQCTTRSSLLGSPASRTTSPCCGRLTAGVLRLILVRDSRTR